MAIPESSLTVRDGGLGLADGNDNGIAAFIGACSSGTANEVNQWSDAQTMRTALGTGPLVEAAAFALASAGGPVITVKAPSSTAGASGSVTPTKTGTATLAVTGATLDAYVATVTIVAGGATLVAGTATFTYTLDSGRTTSPEIAIPVSGVYVIPNTGITLTWSYTSGTAFVAADSWTWTATGPSYTLSEATTALDALIADTSKEPFLVHIVGPPADAAAGVTMFAAIEAKMVAAATTYHRYFRAIMETADEVDATILLAFIASAGTRTMVGLGWAYLISALNGAAYKRPGAWVVTSTACAFSPQEDLGKVRNGPRPGIHSLKRNEYVTQGGDTAGFATLRSIVGKIGYFVTNGRLKVSPGSDFKYLQYGRVVDIGCRALHIAQLQYLNDEIRVNKTTGKIVELDARNIEANLEAHLRAAVTEPGYASSVSVTLDRTINVLSLQKLVVRYRIVPLAYAKTIEGEIALENPALTPVIA